MLRFGASGRPRARAGVTASLAGRQSTSQGGTLRTEDVLKLLMVIALVLKATAGPRAVGWLAMSKPSARSPAGREYQIIELRLMRAQDLFEVPQTDPFSDYRNFLSGVDFCISELRGRVSRRPVQLEIHLPPAELEDAMAERLARTLHRYCDHRIRYNNRESRAQRVGGVSALWVGVPISALGLTLTAVATGMRPVGGAGQLVTDHLGWVLGWLGLWFPLDQFLFYPLAYGRETRKLRLLADARVIIIPHRPGSLSWGAVPYNAPPAAS